MKTHQVRCKCGNFSGFLSNPSRGTRAICYCADCRAFATFMGSPITDAAGGTDVVAVAAQDFKVEKGLEELRCVSLKNGGTFRFYTDCCKTPIGNVPAKSPFLHLGLIHTCLGESPEQITAVFGRVRMKVNTSGVSSLVSPSKGLPLIRSVLRFLFLRQLRRLYGKQINPLVDKRGVPVAPFHVVSPEERA